MARTPCESCGAHYIGRSIGVYPSVLNGTEQAREKGRICARCLKTYRTQIDAHMQPWTKGADNRWTYPEGCNWCGDEEMAEYGGYAFVTVYPGGDVREDFAAQLCARCLPLAKAALLLNAALDAHTAS